MKKLTTSIILSFLFLICVFSCRKDLKEDDRGDVTFPTTQHEKDQVAVIKEVASILETVYQDPYAYYEVNTAIYSDYYEDERVLLKDLLFPESSALYKSQTFLSFKAEKGKFASVFFDAMKKGNYPILRSQLKSFLETKTNSREYSMIAVPSDTTLEIFSNSNGISIYFPYSENFAVPLTTAYFDNINRYPFSTYMATIVAADREADSGPGKEPRKINGGRDVGFFPVTVNDDYAELRATHIVGTGADPKAARPMQPQSVDVVFLGDILCNEQYDNLISFSHLNGGGPDLRFMRGDGFLQPANGQITNAQNTIPVDLKRKDIKKGRWKRVYAIWDSNWEPSNLNQVFGIWEEDKSGTQTYTGSVSTTLANGSTASGSTTGNTTVSSIGYSINVTSKDPIIRQLNWNRESFFLYNHGGLNNGCGTKDGWTIYDCNQTVRYTMPTQ